MKKEIASWLRDLWIWLLALFGEISLIWGDFSNWLISKSALLDALVKALMILILFAYTLKLYVGIKLPILSPIIDKIKRMVGIKDKKIAVISIAESDGEEIENRVKKSKIMFSIALNLFKKGKRIMKNLIVSIGRFIKINKFTILGWISLSLVAVAVYFRIMKPDVVAKHLTDKELLGALGGLISYGLFSVAGYGVESKEAFENRTKDAKARKVYEAEQKARLKDELQRNKLIGVIKKEIETEIVPILKERLLQETKSGLEKVYRRLTDIYPNLNYEMIIADLGNDEVRIQNFLKEIEQLAIDNNLIEVKQVVKVINGVRQTVEEEVNLILEEIKK